MGISQLSVFNKQLAFLGVSLFFFVNFQFLDFRQQKGELSGTYLALRKSH